MSIDKYLFWDMIQGIVKNLDNVTEYKEDNWVKNLCFKEDLNDDIKLINNALGVD